MSDTQTTEGTRFESVESHLAWIEKTVDDLDGVMRELFGRMERLEKVVGRLDHQLERLVEAVTEAKEPLSPPT